MRILGLMRLLLLFCLGKMVRPPISACFGCIGFEENRLRVAIGVATSNIVAPTDGNGTASAGPAVKIMGTKATITVPWPTYRPTEYTIHWHDNDKTPERYLVRIPGKGMHWQADATARG